MTAAAGSALLANVDIFKLNNLRQMYWVCIFDIQIYLSGWLVGTHGIKNLAGCSENADLAGNGEVAYAGAF